MADGPQTSKDSTFGHLPRAFARNEKTAGSRFAIIPVENTGVTVSRTLSALALCAVHDSAGHYAFYNEEIIVPIMSPHLHHVKIYLGARSRLGINRTL